MNNYLPSIVLPVDVSESLSIMQGGLGHEYHYLEAALSHLFTLEADAVSSLICCVVLYV